jgi:hypothetical protein
MLTTSKELRTLHDRITKMGKIDDNKHFIVLIINSLGRNYVQLHYNLPYTACRMNRISPRPLPSNESRRKPPWNSVVLSSPLKRRLSPSPPLSPDLSGAMSSVPTANAFIIQHISVFALEERWLGAPWRKPRLPNELLLESHLAPSPQLLPSLLSLRSLDLPRPHTLPPSPHRYSA